MNEGVGECKKKKQKKHTFLGLTNSSIFRNTVEPPAWTLLNYEQNNKQNRYFLAKFKISMRRCKFVDNKLPKSLKLGQDPPGEH